MQRSPLEALIKICKRDSGGSGEGAQQPDSPTRRTRRKKKKAEHDSVQLKLQFGNDLKEAKKTYVKEDGMKRTFANMMDRENVSNAEPEQKKETELLILLKKKPKVLPLKTGRSEHHCGAQRVIPPQSGSVRAPKDVGRSSSSSSKPSEKEKEKETKQQQVLKGQKFAKAGKKTSTKEDEKAEEEKTSSRRTRTTTKGSSSSAASTLAGQGRGRGGQALPTARTGGSSSRRASTPSGGAQNRTKERNGEPKKKNRKN